VVAVLRYGSESEIVQLLLPLDAARWLARRSANFHLESSKSFKASDQKWNRVLFEKVIEFQIVLKSRVCGAECGWARWWGNAIGGAAFGLLV
jgi:hypothetical protein